MLTIHTPIELTVNPSMLHLNDNFTQRLIGNYQMIGNGLETEDMLHFISQPPEIYLAQGGMTSLVEQSSIVENQNLKLDVINNVLNRIITADTYQMTYQDQVFIESVLRRMGVTDVRMFMKQVENIRQEIKNVNRLTDLYWNESELLTQLREYRQVQTAGEQGAADERAQGEESDVLYLHQEIMNRLQTGVIYQELRNYLSSSTSHHHMISREEMQVSEQTITAQNILLNKLKNYTMMEEQPLVYHYLNTYELGDELELQEDQSKVINQMVQAVLLNAVHQMYALRSEELTRLENAWYQLAGSVYQATENTLQRFVDYRNQFFVYEKDADLYSRMVQQYQRNEIRAIEQYVTNQNLEAGRGTAVLNAGEEANASLVFPQIPEAEEEDLPQDAGGALTQNIRTTEIHGQQIQSLTVQENLLKQQLEQINQNNIRNSKLLQQFIVPGETTAQDGRINRAKAKQDALRAISSPEEVLLTYMESETTQTEREATERENLVQVFGEDTIRIFETIEKYQKTPGLMTKQGVVIPNAADMLLRDIRVQEARQQSEVVHETREIVQETTREQETKALLREYLPEQVTQIQRETQTHLNRVELVHKQQEESLEEAMLEQLRQIQRTTQIENVQIKEQVLEKNTTQEIINSHVNELQVRQNEELARLISEKVQKQLGNLSEQVYGKLEKRMDTERRRRGL